MHFHITTVVVRAKWELQVLDKKGLEVEEAKPGLGSSPAGAAVNSSPAPTTCVICSIPRVMRIAVEQVRDGWHATPPPDAADPAARHTARCRQRCYW